MNIIRRILKNINTKPFHSFEFKSYRGFGPVNFGDNYKTALDKLAQYSPIETESDQYRRNNKAIYVKSANLMVVFNDKANGIFYFEVEKGGFIHNGNNIFKMGYKKARAYAEKLDPNIKIDEDCEGFDSPALGFRVQRELINGKYTDTLEYILAYSHEYAAYPHVTAEEILKDFYNQK